MKIAVVGSGYVGLVAGACFADSGHDVICVDCDAQKIRLLSQGQVPIFEPGLAELIHANLKAKRMHFTTDLAEAVRKSRIIVLAIGTPPATDGSADLSAALSVAREIGKAMDGYRIIVMKSTVPVGTHKKVCEAIADETNHPFDYVSNPEFLKEGAAIEDFTKPDRVILGTTNPAVVATLKALYGPFMRKSERILVMDPASAEMTKYAANAMLAARISFMNEVAALCDRLGADIEAVRRGIGTDSRIGNAFLFPGVGYGGSCFPKDVQALVSMGEAADCPMNIIAAVQEVNQRQRRMFARRVIEFFRGRRPPITLAVWGLAFKARTDDVRESPASAGVKMFLDQAFKVRAHDPEAMGNAAQIVGDAVAMIDDEYDALEGADALVIFTDWPKFRAPDFDLIAERLPSKVIFDGRNMYDPAMLAAKGFQYFCIGRPTVKPSS
jgi:UDPglucose 6-dehydrogenase